ncbi:hypothetical protein QR680_008024 [Steinernema hermaphroditum]|uniref:Uncharacterized protein n=1 Tax=Steinernema hermaphroditum TaxID=289476 RepID=A0AA39IHI4_9BILA|nr:hypothetical protein QR680_008024 [Steinernema hermaphroditum]
MDFSRQLDYSTLEVAGRVVSVPGNVKRAYTISFFIFLVNCSPLLFVDPWNLVIFSLPVFIGATEFTLLGLALFRNIHRKLFLASFTVFIGLLSMTLTQMGLFHFAQAVKYQSLYLMVIPFVLWNFAGVYLLVLFYFYRLYKYIEIDDEKKLIMCYEAEKKANNEEKEKNEEKKNIV